MNDMPITVRRSIELLGLFVAGFIVRAGSHILMPLLLAFFISILLVPLVRFFRQRRVPEIVAIFLPIFCVTVFAGGIGWLFYGQLASLAKDLPVIGDNVTRLLDRLSIWISQVFGYSPDEQLRIINQNSGRFLGYGEGAVRQLASSISSWFVFFGLLPVYVFFILLYRSIFVKFVHLSVKDRGGQEAAAVITLLEKVVKRYLLGLLIQFAYMIFLLGGLLSILGIKHGWLIGLLFAFLNLIPYLGPLIGNILGVAIVFASSNSMWDVVLVFTTITIVQFLDNNILMPRIVGSQVKLNALVSIVGIFIGGALAGISGMFLAMPVMAVMKLLFDHSVGFRNWGVLLGE